MNMFHVNLEKKDKLTEIADDVFELLSARVFL